MSARETPSVGAGRPFAISLLLGASGWFAGLFVLILAALVFQPEHGPSAAIIGLVFLAAAWAMFKAVRDAAKVFIDQLALAFSLAGQCLVLYAASSSTDILASIPVPALVLQVVLALVMPNRLHRTLSTLFATIAWALTIHGLLFHGPAGWHDEPAAVPLPAALGGWLLTWGPPAAMLWWAIRNEAAWMARGWSTLTQPIITGLIVGLAFSTIASQPFEAEGWPGGNGHGHEGSLALWPLLSAVAALGALAAAFAQGRRGLMALCAIAALLHVAAFYYTLGTSLLVKSLVMLVIGLACVASARVLRAEGKS